MPGKVLLRSLDLSAFGKLTASAYQDGIVLPLLYFVLGGGFTIFVGSSLGKPLTKGKFSFQMDRQTDTG